MEDVQVVYVVEIRENTEEDGMQCTVMYLASTLEKAIVWMKKNMNCSGDNDLWWWAVYPMPIDLDHIEEWKVDLRDELHYFNRHVEEIYWQPHSGEATIRTGETLFFDFERGEYSYLKDFKFRGKLTSTENGILTFEDVHQVIEGGDMKFFSEKVIRPIDNFMTVWR